MRQAYKIIYIAIAKGVLHATVIPLSLMFISLYATNSIYAFLTPFAYIAFASYVYATSENKDISKIAFFTTTQVVFLLVLIYLWMVIAQLESIIKELFQARELFAFDNDDVESYQKYRKDEQ